MNNPATSDGNNSVAAQRVSMGRVVAMVAGAILSIVIAALLGLWWRSNQPEGLYLRGRTAIENGDPKTAKQLADTLTNMSGYESKGHLLRGLLLARSGLYSDALKHLELASQQESTVVEASSAAARCLYAMGRYMETIDAAHAALQRDPHCYDATRWLAAAYYDLGAMPNAIAELEKLKEEVPTDPRPDRLLGLIAKDGEHFKQSIEHYRESLRRVPRQSDREAILREMAESQIAQSEFNDALKTLREAVRSAETLTLEATCLRGLGQLELADHKIREALDLNPLYFPARMLQGALFLDHEDLEQAVSATKKAVEIDPNSSKARLQLSQALRQLGRVEDADVELNAMLKIQALERRFSDLHDTASKQPSDANVRYQIGDLARQLGKLELARMWFRAVLAIDPRHPQARTALNELDHPAVGHQKDRKQ